MTSNSRKTFCGRLSALTAAFSIFIFTPANADHIATYGDFDGTDVMYTDVTESASAPGDHDLPYGRPAIANDSNSLEFNPPVVVPAMAESGQDDELQSVLDFSLSGLGVAITELRLDGIGSYGLSGTGTDATAVTVESAVSQVVVSEVDGAPVSSPIILPQSSTSSSFNLSGGEITDQPWTTSLTYDLNTALTSAGVSFQYGATSIQLQASNTFGASSESASGAIIGPTRLSIIPTTVPVPEPSGLMIASIALFAVWSSKRRS